MKSTGNKIKRTLAVLGIIFTLGFLGTGTCFSLEISVRENSVIRGETILIGDIAEFTPSDDARIKSIKDIEISAAPAPGSIRRLNRDLVEYRLLSVTRKYQDIALNAFSSVTVTRDSQLVSRETLETMFTDYILNNCPWDPEAVLIEKVNAPESVTLPVGDLTWEISEKRNNKYIGSISLVMDFSIDGQSIKKIIISGKISITKDVLRTARNIDSGDIISSGDLMTVSETIRSLRSDPVISIQEVIGKRATRRINANQKIRLGMFEVPPLIEKGDTVIIKAENDEIKITVSGEALEQGCSGDRIRVRNARSGKEIIATVKNSDVVEVYF